MAVGTDRVQLTKLESTAKGGDSADAGPYDSPQPIDPQEDAIEAAGIYLQDASNRDESVYVARAGDDLTFRDVNNTTPKTLTELQAPGGNHGTTHHEGGADALNVEDLASAGTADQWFKADGAGGVDLFDWPFGRERQGYADDTLTSTSTKGSWFEVLTFTTATLPAGDYLLTWYCEPAIDSANNRLGFRVQVDGSDVVLTDFWPPSTAVVPVSGWKVITVASPAALQIDLDIDQNSGGPPRSISAQNRRVYLWRVN